MRTFYDVNNQKVPRFFSSLRTEKKMLSLLFLFLLFRVLRIIFGTCEKVEVEIEMKICSRWREVKNFFSAAKNFFKGLKLRPRS